MSAGGVIALPTETVYGLAADVTNAAAVRRIYAIKGRPLDHPLIVHVPGPVHLERYAAEVPAAARRAGRALLARTADDRPAQER